MRSKVIEGYENYTIYEDGKVYSNKSKKFLKIRTNAQGRYFVAIYNEVKQVNKRIHRLLAEAFIPNPNNYPLVRHLNDDCTDNRLCNLAWGTRSDNEKDKYRNGHKIHLRKLSEEQVIAIFHDPRTCLEIAKDYPVGKSTVGNIKTKQAYKEITKEL